MVVVVVHKISDFPGGSLEQASSTTVMYDSLGGPLGLWKSWGLLLIGILALV